MYVQFRILDVRCASVIDWQRCLQSCVLIASARIYQKFIAYVTRTVDIEYSQW